MSNLHGADKTDKTIKVALRWPNGLPGSQHFVEDPTVIYKADE